MGKGRRREGWGRGERTKSGGVAVFEGWGIVDGEFEGGGGIGAWLWKADLMVWGVFDKMRQGLMCLGRCFITAYTSNGTRQHLYIPASSFSYNYHPTLRSNQQRNMPP